jgi:hypothetical protein
MPTPTYTPLANVTLGSAHTTVTFSNIPATYRDLILNINGSTTSGVRNVGVRLNGDSTATYAFVRMNGSGTTATSTSGSTGTSLNAGILGSAAIGQIMFSLFDYSATDKHKTSLVRGDLSNEGTQAVTGRYPSTSAITSLACILDSNTFAIGTTFSLYGVIA